MGKFCKWSIGGLLAVLVVTANAAEKKEAAAAIRFWGNTEAGFGYSWQQTGAATSDSRNFFVDYLNFNVRADVSEKTKVVFNNAFFLTSRTPGTTNIHGTPNFMSAFRITGTNFGIASQAAYIDHKCGEGFHTWIGNFTTPFGMESMGDRYDMATYYYSSVAAAFMNGAIIGRGGTDLGIKVALTDHVPGTLEIALLEGGSTGAPAGVVAVTGPAAALRWSMDVKNGDTTWSPVLSTYLGNWRSGPKDMGFSAGVNMKMSALWANVEWLYSIKNVDPNADPQNKAMSIYVEPGFDAGFASISAKAEFVNSTLGAAAAQSDFNVGLAIGKTYQGGHRIRLAYSHTGLSGNVAYTGATAAHVNDFRLLFGTKF